MALGLPCPELFHRRQWAFGKPFLILGALGVGRRACIGELLGPIPILSRVPLRGLPETHSSPLRSRRGQP